MILNLDLYVTTLYRLLPVRVARYTVSNPMDTIQLKKKIFYK